MKRPPARVGDSRGALAGPALAVLLLGVGSLLPLVAFAQPCAPDLLASRTIRTAGYALAYRTDPEAIQVGRHFSLEFAVCPSAGVPAPAAVRVDARMPAHRHGMNYSTRVSTAANGHYRAEGLMFHMPGRWELIFDLRVNGGTERLAQEIVLE